MEPSVPPRRVSLARLLSRIERQEASPWGHAGIDVDIALDLLDASHEIDDLKNGPGFARENEDLTRRLAAAEARLETMTAEHDQLLARWNEYGTKYRGMEREVERAEARCRELEAALRPLVLRMRGDLSMGGESRWRRLDANPYKEFNADCDRAMAALAASNAEPSSEPTDG